MSASRISIEIVQLLLHKGADINAADKEGITALMCAHYYGNIEIVTLLLKQPMVDINAVDESGYTVLMQACGKDSVNMVKLLLQNDADIDLGSKRGKTALLMITYARMVLLKS